jgi:hypothetical protein
MYYYRRFKVQLSHVFDTSKLAFIHVPKTGGSYLAHGERPLDSMRYLAHSYITHKAGTPNPIYEYQPEYENSRPYTLSKSQARKYYKFSTVRNIYTWLVSYAWHAGGWNPKYRNTEHYDFDAANKGFDYLLKTIVDRETIWPNRKFIHCQLFASDGELIVDWINRNETLDDDLSQLAAHVNVSYTRQTRKRVARDDDYRTYYTDNLTQLVEDTWGRELSLFGYDFDGLNDNYPDKLYHHIKCYQKKQFQYSWETDILIENEMKQ